MNKKIIGIIAAATVAASCSTALADTTVTVTVDGSVVDYEDQQPIIENDRTLIPVRGAFEAMGASVDWDGDTQTVTVSSSTNTRIAVLTIGSDIMTTYTYKNSLFDVDKEEVQLDVAAKIVNDRTMIPLRAIGEALGAQVDWDGDTYTASIVTKTVSEETISSTAALSLSQDESENADEVVISVNLANFTQYENSYVAGVTLGLNYDPEALEYVSGALYNGDAKVENAIGAENTEFGENRLKVSYITVDDENAASSDGCVMKVVFKKLTDDPGSVSLSTAYNSKLGYDTYVIVDAKTDEGTVKSLNPSDGLVVDTTALELN